jgi:polar amino acid transport system ATP-binding protein/sulfate transport system ATP-binding protein
VIAARRTGAAHDVAVKNAEERLERFGLGGCGSKYPFQLSGGERQRVAIAQQFLCSEHFLLMDEPFSGLDPIALENVCDLIGELANAHTLNTVIVVTHDIAAAIAVSDTLWLLGRDSDASGALIAGARVRARYDLIERGLTWRKGISSTPEFLELDREIRERFRLL